MTLVKLENVESVVSINIEQLKFCVFLNSLTLLHSEWPSFGHSECSRVNECDAHGNVLSCCGIRF